MANVTETLSLLIKVIKGQAEADLASFGKTAKSSLVETEKATSGFGATLTGLGVSGLAAAGGIAAVGAAAYKAIGDYTGLASQVRKFQTVTGETAQTSSRLVEVLKEFGVDPDAAAVAIGRFEKNLGSANKTLVEYGVTIEKTKSGRVDMVATLADVIDKLNATENITKKNDLATAAFGRGWQTLTPLIARGGAELKTALAGAPQGGILTQAQVDTGTDLAVSLSRVTEEAKALETELVGDLAPGVLDLVNGLVVLIKGADNATSALGGLAGLAKTIIDTSPLAIYGKLFGGNSKKQTTDASAALNDLQNSIEKLGGKAASENNPVSSFFGSITKFARDLPANVAKNILDNAAEGATKLASAEQGLTSAQKDATAAIDDYHRAQKDVVDAQENRQRLLRDEVKANEKVADSIQHVADVQAEAARSAAGAQRDLERAQNDVNRAAEKGDIQGYADAQLGLADAQDRVASTSQSNANNLKDANSAVADSRQAAIDSAKAYTDSAQTVQDAQKRVQDAIEASAEKATALAQAVAALDSAQSGGAVDASKSIDDQRAALVNLEAQYAATFGPDSAPVKGVQHLIDLLNQQQTAVAGAQALLAGAGTGTAGTGSTSGPGFPMPSAVLPYGPYGQAGSEALRLTTQSSFGASGLPPTIVQHIYGISPDVAFQEAAAKIRPVVSLGSTR